MKELSKSTNWANNAMNIVSSLYGQGADAEFIAGALSTAAAVASTMYLDVKKRTPEEKTAFVVDTDAAFERAKMMMRAMKPTVNK